MLGGCFKSVRRRRSYRIFCALAIAVLIPASVVLAQSDALKALRARATELYEQGRYTEAVPLAEQYAESIKAQSGEDSGDYASALSDLGLVLTDVERYTEAEGIIRRAISLLEDNFGPDDRQVARAINNLANLLLATNRLAEAEPLMRRSIQILEDTFGPEHQEVAVSLNSLAILLRKSGRLDEAEQLFRRALAINEKKLGPDHPRVASALNNLAELLRDKGRFQEAERLYRRSIAIVQRTQGLESPELCTTLDNLAGVLVDTQRFTEAEPLIRRAIAIAERSLGPDHSDVSIYLSNLGNLLYLTDRLVEAERVYRRALQIEEKKLGPEHPQYAVTLQNLGRLLGKTGRISEAEPLYRRGLAIAEKSFGANHPETAYALTNLARPLMETGRLDEAESLLRRALAIDERNYGRQSSEFATSLANVAVALERRQNWLGAVSLYEQALPLMVEDRDQGSNRSTNPANTKLTSNSGNLRAYARALYRARLNVKRALEQGFDAAQWASQSSTAEALSQMANRFSRGSGPLASLVRERQDALAQYQSAVRQLDAFVGSGEAETANAARASIESLDKTLDALDAKIADNFKEYAELSAPKPFEMDEAQKLLDKDEALIVFLDIPAFSTGRQEETLAWAITKTQVRWQSIPSGPETLLKDVSTLRCGLDYEGAWFDEKGAWNSSRCNGLFKLSYSRVDHDVFRKPLPFDLVRAHALYKTLFGPFEDLIKDKRLLIVPTGPLTQLPFQVLVTEPPKAARLESFISYRDVAWFARKHAVSVLPAVSSLRALREFAKESHARETYIGFGDPLLDGEPEKAPDEQAKANVIARAEAARDLRCEQVRPRQIAMSDVLHEGGGSIIRGPDGLANVASLRKWSPLPETAVEICDVANKVGDSSSARVYIGADATEERVKQLSDDRVLANYKIVHFATHGAVAGDVSGTNEPGLILTPPTHASDANDGYLSASEIATLKLDADWVILSACNTAAGSAKSAESLSGLARAFFFAGARSLLVSHWSVDSFATEALITDAVAKLKSDPDIGRSEALRRSMLAMIDNGETYQAHPAYWAPFVLVGEGGADR
jgi:CHAT domain-containing protein/tetratricopeptide (TPR) repeat protein